MVTWSPGRTTRPIMRPRPAMMFDTVSCRPKEMTTEVTPRAATNAVGWTPKTGSSTASSANTQMTARTMFTKIDALGTPAASSARLRPCTTMRCTSSATPMTTARKTIFPMSADVSMSARMSPITPSRWPNGSWEAMILSRMRQRDCPFVSSRAASGMASGAKRLDVRPLFMVFTSAFPPDGTTLSALWHGLVPQ